MKTKSLHLLASALLLAFASCTSDIQELNTEQSPLLKQIVMTTEDFEPEAGSRTLYDIADGAVKCTWAENDTVGVFPDKGGQVYFPMISGAGTKNASFDGEGWALKDGRTYGAYYPFIADILLDRNAVPVSYTGQKQVGNGSMAHLGDYDYMVAAPTAPEFGSAQFMFKHLSALVQLKITVPQPATLTSVKLVTENNLFFVEGEVDLMETTPSIAPITPANEIELALQDISTTQANQEVMLYMMIPPTNLRAQTLKAIFQTDKGKEEVVLDSKNFQSGTIYLLSGEMEGAVAGYKDGVVTITEAGTMKQLLGDDYLNITSLKVVGPINGDDVRCLRQMLGGDIEDGVNIDKGSLTSLDLSDASIVEGGSYYYSDYYSEDYYTSNDMIGGYMFYGCGNLQDIVLPVGVTSIGNYAFSGCSSLASIDIPEGVTSIGYTAFSCCSSLTSIDIPAGVTSIGDLAFYGCSSLTSIDIPESVTSIGYEAFYRCSSLTSIAIPEGVTSIGGYAFEFCSSLKSVHITDLSAWCKITFSSYSSNPLYYAEKFYLNNEELTELIIPADVKKIKDYAFYGYINLKKVIINDGVTSIENLAFVGCSSLTSIDIPKSVTSIGRSTFSGCSSLASIAIPESVTSIGEWAFSGCSSLTQVYCYGTTPPTINSFSEYSSFNGSKDGKTLYVPKGYLSVYQSSSWVLCFGTITEMD